MTEGSTDPEIQPSNSTFREKIHSGVEYFKRKKIMASDKPTRLTKIPGTEDDRGMVERFERAEIFRAYLGFRDEIKQAKKQGDSAAELQSRLLDFRQKAKVFEKTLDRLNEQFYQNQEVMHIDGPEIGVVDDYIVTLDLNPPKEGEEDKRIPYFLIPTYVANAHNVANLAIDLASEGQKVIVMSHPENRVTTPTKEALDDWLAKVKQEASFKLHSEVGKKIIEKMGLDKVNLIGTSTGALVAIEMAADPELADKINDLIVIEPPGVIEKSPIKLLFQFLGGEGINAIGDRGVLLKTSGPSERPELQKTEIRDAKIAKVLAPILASQQITADKLGRVNPKGKFQVWVGNKSYITGDEALKVLVREGVDRDIAGLKQMQIINFEGGHNVPFSRVGVGAIIIANEHTDESVVHLSSKDLDHSLAERIIKGQSSYLQ